MVKAFEGSLANIRILLDLRLVGNGVGLKSAKSKINNDGLVHVHYTKNARQVALVSTVE